MKKLPIFIAAVFLVLGSIYALLPEEGFPEPILGSVRSEEPADVETPLRRGYFTDATRDEVVVHYKKEFSSLPTINLNYPPEEAQTLIRDQTKSTYLEELVHPGRESIFINGFEPRGDHEAIVVDGKRWGQKVIVRHVPSHVGVRLLVVVGASIVVWGLAHFALYKRP